MQKRDVVLCLFTFSRSRRTLCDCGFVTIRMAQGHATDGFLHPEQSTSSLCTASAQRVQWLGQSGQQVCSLPATSITTSRPSGSKLPRDQEVHRSVLWMSGSSSGGCPGDIHAFQGREPDTVQIGRVCHKERREMHRSW